jgi:hypothetical protein
MTPSTSTTTYDRTSRSSRTRPPYDSHRLGALSAEEIQRDLAWKYEMVPGSLRFIPASTTEEQAMIFFTVLLLDGTVMHGRIEIRCWADEGVMRIWPDVEVGR